MKIEFIQKHTTLVQIAAVIGDEATVSVVNKFGGRQIFPSYERLEPVIGKDAATLLAKELRGTEIYIPSCRRDSIEARNAALIDKFDDLTNAGQSARQAVAALSEEYGIGDRRIWKILKRGAR